MFRRMMIPWWILVVTVLLLLAAVLSGAQMASAKTVLTVVPWAGMGEKVKGGEYDIFLQEYQKVHPDIEFKRIDGVPMNSYDGLPKLLLLLEGGGTTVPDIVETHLSLLPDLMEHGIVAPMPEDLAKEVKEFFFAPVLVPLQKDGKLWGLPTEYQLYALGYNQRVFDEEGIPAPPSTWMELRQLAVKGTKFNPNGSIKRWGFGFPGGWAGHGEASTHSFLAFLWSNGGTYLDKDGNPHLTDVESLETLQFLRDLTVAKAMSLVGWGGIQDNTVFMAVTPSWARDGYVKAMKDDYKNVTTTFIPRNKGPLATCQYGWGFFVTSKSQHKKEAWEFLRWLTMQESPRGLTRTGESMRRLGSVPTNQMDLNARPELRTELFWRGFMQLMKYARPEPHFPMIMARWKELGKALEPVLTGNVPPLQGLDAAQKAIIYILKKSSK